VTRSTLASLFLGAALIGTNVFWAYWAVDASLSYTYQAVSLEDNQQALAQALAVIKVAVRPDASKEQVIGAASMTATPSPQIFEKDGYIWVGQIGLDFDAAGRLVEVVPAWSSLPADNSEPPRQPQ
jgi:hypothetical protein